LKKVDTFAAKTENQRTLPCGGKKALCAILREHSDHRIQLRRNRLAQL